MNQGEIFNNKYRIIKVLGHGGMGTVYLAENIRLGNLWAIKRIGKNNSFSQEINIEYNILKKLNHPALPRIFDVIEDDESINIIVDYIEGQTLDEELSKSGRVQEERVVDWAIQICDVLGYLHEFKPNPIIYRDMKPSNIMLNTEGKIKLIDFGIAREFKKEAGSDTVYIGTRGYAAPEQFGFSQTNASTDIYSLGITLHFLVTGKNPIEAPFEILPVRSFNDNLSEELEKIIIKCTQEKPEERYQTIRELEHDIQTFCCTDKAVGQTTNTKKELTFKIPKDYKKVAGFAGSDCVGTSTIIAALSENFVSKGKRVAVVDLSRNCYLYEMFGRNFSKSHSTFADVCENSLKYLFEGILKPLHIGINRDFFISDKPIELQKNKFIDLFELLLNEYEIVLLNLDFESEIEALKHLNHLFLVKDMNPFNVKETSSYIKLLKQSSINLMKISFIINNVINCKLKPKMLIDALGVIEVEETGKYEIFTNDTSKYFTIPYEVEDYKQYINNFNHPFFSCVEFCEGFKRSIGKIAETIYPLREKITLGSQIKSFIKRGGRSA